MAIKPFFDVALTQEIIGLTGGVRVVYRGREGEFHCEKATGEVMHFFSQRVTGISHVLIGDIRCFPSIERNKQISVAGEDFMVGDIAYPDDGGVIYIALTESTRS